MDLPAGFARHDVVLDGVKLHYAEGPASGPPVVLVPGQSMPLESYLKVMPRLRDAFHVFVMDVRGHGRSQHTPGDYSFTRCGKDLANFLEAVVQAPAFVAGNSSGGIIALWAGANAPRWVRGVMMEDPPLFTTEWPRLRDDTWVYQFFVHVVATLPDLAGFFSSLKVPSQRGKKLMSFPRPMAWLLGGAVRRHQRAHPGAPVDIPWLPLHVRLFVRGLSEYDVDFTRACTDGRMCDLDQGAALSALKCPATLIVAASFRHPTLGLVGAMGEEDVALARQLSPELRVVRLDTTHVVHLSEPRRYVEELVALSRRLG
jgi:pimeloyl-ACP methyl ester carboxylesterase